MDDIGDALQLGVTQNDEESPADLNISEVSYIERWIAVNASAGRSGNTRTRRRRQPRRRGRPPRSPPALASVSANTDRITSDTQSGPAEFLAGFFSAGLVHAISIADPTFGVGVCVDETMYRHPTTAPPPSAPQPSGGPRMPYVRIVEQPAGKSLRFRYECEGRSAGSIPGANSTPERKTYPTIEVVGYTGRFVVLVSCVTKDKPYRPHPHNLVGREPMCNRGVCTVEMNGETNMVQFSNLGIQCVKRKDIAEALRVREEIKVDPFKTGFNHNNQAQNIDLNAVRLCFQVYIPGGNTSKIKQALVPVVSDVIYDKKAMCELQINRLSTGAASVRGGTELILLCEKVTRDDVEVVFSKVLDDGSLWEASANIVLVHKQVAIAFEAPAYHDPTCMENVKVKIYLKRVSDSARSAPVPFEYTPDYADSDYLSKKKRKTAQSTLDSLLQSTYKQDRTFHESAIKTEPRDASPGLQIHSPPMGVASPHYQQQYRDPGDPRYQQWMHEPSNLAVPGTNPFLPDNRGYWGPQNFGQTSPSPNLNVSPNMQSISPNMQAMSPNMQAMSPNMQAMSPAHRLSPIAMQQSMPGPGMAMGQGLVQLSPMQGGMSPGHQISQMHQLSPMHLQSPPPQPMPMQNVAQPMEAADSLTFNSADLSGIIATLDATRQQGPELSDSLRQLSTSDLISTMPPM